jgi:biopolymer transport protein ExbB/TolQ
MQLLGSWTETFIFSWYVMVPLMLCSIISLAIIFERILSLRPDIVIKPSLARAIHELNYGGKTTLVEQESAEGRKRRRRPGLCPARDRPP